MKNLIITMSWINRIVLALTLLLYITVILGLYAQVVLGAVQILFFIILVICNNKINEKQSRNLLRYFVMVVLYFFALYFIRENHLDIKHEAVFIIGLIIIPLTLAGFFTYIVEEIRKSYE